MKLKHFLILLMALIGISAKAVTFNYTYEGSTLKYEITSVSKCKVIGYMSLNNDLKIPASVSYNGRSFNVTGIGDAAFNECHTITSVVIPNSVITIGMAAFDWCSGLKYIVIPNSVTSIGEFAFAYCSGMRSIVIPNSVNLIGDYAFYYCSNLVSVKIPASVNSISNYAFSYCGSLTTITIPNTVTSIGDGAFDFCSSLTSVTIPFSVASIGINPFKECSKLESINVDAENNNFCVIDGVLFNKSMDTIIAYLNKSSNTYTVPISVTTIRDYAFSDGSKLSDIRCSANIPPTCGKSAFNSIGPTCNLYVPASSIDKYRIADGWKKFYNIQSLPEQEFTYTYKGQTLNYIVIDAYAKKCAVKRNNNISGDLYIPAYVSNGTNTYEVTSIGNYAFDECSELKTVSIPNSITSIGNNAFSFCRTLSSVTIPNSVISIGESAFECCISLESVTIPNSVSSIGSAAFQLCSSLKEIYCLAVVPPICNMSTFEVVYSCNLYVPKISVEAYRIADQWKYLYNIIGYYVPGGENESLYIQDFFIEPGEVAYMPVRVRGERDYTEFSTDIYLPEGLEVVTNEEGYIDVQYACVEDDAHLIFADSQPDGAIRVSVMSFDNAPMIGNGSEELFRLPVRATSSLASGPVPVWMRNTMFKDANYGYLFNDANPHINADGVMGGADVEVSSMEAVYYNLQGVRVAQPERGGVYICVQGGKARKLVF